MLRMKVGGKLKKFLPSILRVWKVDNVSRVIDTKGYLVDILTHIQKRLNFTAKHVVPEDGMWGDADESGTWNGLVRLLIQKKVC